MFFKSLGDLTCCESSVIILRLNNSRKTCPSRCDWMSEGMKKAFIKQRAITAAGSKSEGIEVTQMGYIIIW